jgi:hypothetical protein
LGSLIAFPFGFGVAAIPVLCFAAAEAIAALFIPSSASFRNMVDKNKRAERREQVRKHLVEKITRRTPEGPLWDLYASLLDRVESLRQMVGNRATSLSERDVERLDDATVDFLSLWLGRLSMVERLEAVDEAALRRKLDQLERQIKDTSDVGNRKHLQQAKADLERVLTRRQRLVAKQAAVEAAQLALADTFDEVYQGVMTNPTSSDNSRQLQEAVERLQIEEELDLSGEDFAEPASQALEEANDDRNNPRRTPTDIRLRAREPQR